MSHGRFHELPGGLITFQQSCLFSRLIYLQFSISSTGLRTLTKQPSTSPAASFIRWELSAIPPNKSCLFLVFFRLPGARSDLYHPFREPCLSPTRFQCEHCLSHFNTLLNWNEIKDDQTQANVLGFFQKAKSKMRMSAQGRGGGSTEDHVLILWYGATLLIFGQLILCKSKVLNKLSVAAVLKDNKLSTVWQRLRQRNKTVW